MIGRTAPRFVKDLAVKSAELGDAKIAVSETKNLFLARDRDLDRRRRWKKKGGRQINWLQGGRTLPELEVLREPEMNVTIVAS